MPIIVCGRTCITRRCWFGRRPSARSPCAAPVIQFKEVTMARKCLNCEARKEMTRFEDETFTIEHAGITVSVEGLSGWRCGACGEVEFDADSARRYAAAGDELVRRYRERVAE